MSALQKIIHKCMVETDLRGKVTTLSTGVGNNVQHAFKSQLLVKDGKSVPEFHHFY